MDLDQALAALTEDEAKDVLGQLVSALHDEDTDRCYTILRHNGLEEIDEDNT